MKELNIVEASTMRNTEFKIIYPDWATRIHNVFTNDKGDFYDAINKTIINPRHFLIQAKFIPIAKPVSFIEAIQSGKKIRCDVEDLGINESTTEYLEKYHYLIDILAELPERLTNIGIKDVILNGKWYIED